MDSGSAIPSTSRDAFYRLPVSVPTIAEQRAIAATLGALDNKIESNRRAVETAQELLRALFECWFVEYQPWGGEAPASWRVGTLQEVVKLVKKPTRAGARPDLPYVPIDSLPMGTLGLHESRPSEQAKSSLSLFTKNDILFGAMRVYFHRVSLAPYEGITRNTTFVLRPNSPEYLAFALLLLDRDSTIDYASATSKGSTMPYAVWDGALADMQATIPDLATAAAFNDHVEPLLTLVRDGYNESRRLAALRDALRPELLSGRVRVPVEEGV